MMRWKSSQTKVNWNFLSALAMCFRKSSCKLPLRDLPGRLTSLGWTSIVGYNPSNIVVVYATQVCSVAFYGSVDVEQETSSEKPDPSPTNSSIAA